jgi:NAD(P)-dependent dehydrogenase (short-subunit alcohol dehydrogenase family)
MAVVLITGCSTGIGRTTALALGRRGHRVYATMRTPQRAADLLQIVDDEQLDVRLVALDVTDPESVTSTVSHILDIEGRIDAAVNNAGVGPFAPIEHSTDADWLTTFDTNLFGAVRVTRAVLPAMRAQHAGTIVNVSSIASRIASVPTQGAYAASKHALCCLTDSLVAECSAFGIRAYCVEPGFFATAIMDKDTVAALATDDPYHDLQDGVEQFFRLSLAAAPQPDAVADLIAEAIERGLEGGIHHPVGVEGATPTASAARS